MGGWHVRADPYRPIFLNIVVLNRVWLDQVGKPFQGFKALLQMTKQIQNLTIADQYLWILR